MDYNVITWHNFFVFTLKKIDTINKWIDAINKWINITLHE